MGMSTEHLNGRSTDTDDYDPQMAQRTDQMLSLWHQYKNVFETTGFANSEAFKATEKWIQATKFVNDRSEVDRIETREDFFRTEFAQLIMRDGIPVYQEFNRQLNASTDYISKASRDRWTKRFYDEKVSFAAKKYWVQHQLPSYVDAWKKLAEDRIKLTKESGFKDLIATYPKFKILDDSQKEAFLDLHFDKRKDLLSEARAALLSLGRGQNGYYQEASKALYAAVAKGVLSSSKVGMWLQRIFKKGWSAEHIEKFLHGGIKDSLPTLISNWTKVKVRYDNAMRKARERGEDLDARGYPMLSEGQFLDLPFGQRLHYVQELESRLDDAKSIASERPIFLKIRHAMDSKDWEDAAMLIAEAKADPEISGKDRTRLLSMESYTKKFSRNRQGSSMENVVYAKRRMDTILRDLGKSHSEVAVLCAKLARGQNANRSLGQLRWTVYNNKWCRGRGYLDDNIARKGASKENERLTKERALQGKDIGRHDVISYETAGDQFVRKRETANHKATFRHVNVDDGESLNKTAEWFKREQDAKVLYWTTACFHSKGDPKSETWHNELFTALNELRGLSRTIDAADCVYNGVNDSLSRKGAPSKSYSMAA